MRSLPRAALRLGALLLLCALLVGIPIIVVSTVGVPLPRPAQWRDAWTTGRIDDDFVVRLGAAVFMVLWAWFAVTALMELWRVFPRRHEMDEAEVRVAGGPAGWVQGLVRFVAVSSVSASAALAAMSVSAGSPPVRAAAQDTSAVGIETVVPSAFGPAHVVTSGDSYWRIADEHLRESLQRAPSNTEVASLTGALVDANGARLGHRDRTLLLPGELVVLPAITDAPQGVPPPAPPTPAPTPAPTPVVPAVVAAGAPVPVAPPVADPEAPGSADRSSAVARVSSSAQPLSYTAGLGAAVLMSAGALGAVELRRRRQLRAGTVGSRLVAPSIEQVHTEVLLRSLSSSERVARLDVALRSVAKDLQAQRASVVAVVLGEAGDLRVFLRGAAVPTDERWRLDLHGATWQLPASVSLDVLAPSARECAHPCPALAHIGAVEDGGELFVDLEAIGVLTVDSPHAQQIVRALAASLSISPFLESGRVFSVGVGDAVLDLDRGERLDSLVGAVRAAQLVVGTTATLARDVTTFALRVLGSGGEVFEPAIVFAAGVSPDAAEAVGLRDLSGGRGLGVVVDTSVDGAHRLSFDGRMHRLEPLGLEVRPIGVDEADVEAVASLIRSADECCATIAPVQLRAEPQASPVVFVEPEWDLLVKLLGPVEVIDRDGAPVQFERSKALELVVWLSQHRERPTRHAARTALWDVAVRDATFANVVSEARRAMARAVPPPHGVEWIARTLTDDLPLHPGVMTDADVLSARVVAARGLSAIDAIEVLRPGLELVTGMPFAGASFLWSDAEGHTSSLVLLATGAAIELSHRYLELGDVDGVFWATGQGLRVLSGHEELIALRMRAHAHRGDLAGVRLEWESYERAIAADPWAAAEPAEKLVDLRRALLSPSARTSVAGA